MREQGEKSEREEKRKVCEVQKGVEKGRVGEGGREGGGEEEGGEGDGRVVFFLTAPAAGLQPHVSKAKYHLCISVAKYKIMSILNKSVFFNDKKTTPFNSY